MPRIAIAGFQHETNTFGVTRAGFAEFKTADSWPGILIGEALVPGTRGINLPITGFAEAARSDPTIELVPVLWCSAEPSAHVTDDAFERISEMIIDSIKRAEKLDGIYLDLHGAMVTETYNDGEGELLRRIRTVIGNEMPLSVSLDLHANVTRNMVEHADAIAIFRTYPHLDMAETGARSFKQLCALLNGVRYKKAFRQVPFLVPLSAQHTGSEPCRSLYTAIDEAIQQPDCSADIALGFTAADTADTGPSIVAYATEQTTADRVANRLLDAMLAAEDQFDCTLLSPVEAVRAAKAVRSQRPVIIADVQDNPGAGATSDTTGLLVALIEEQSKGALVGLMHDPKVAASAHAAGVGSVIEGALGGKADASDQQPYIGRFLVEALSDGACKYSGEMYDGSTAVLGPCAVLRVMNVAADVRVVVSTNRSQCLDLALFMHIGLDPRLARIVVVKSTIHFRADFEPIAEIIIPSAAPAVFSCQLDRVPYRQLRDGMRLGPMGPAFSSRKI